ncbi:MAG: phosphate ABC transporter substrate-binding protein [Hyphomicrobium sp.]|jgi:phosphate transport system substrate-binding protein|uniref:phosphate ABC transporter substrate-binding protein n=1 Tax=Hyphomicrobium sp. TaxID=82 RepID=UPI0025C2C84E|nr:phosphate ABC transporter substrate-binding protein [Hyphomicrobium sp.]MBX9863941.1 phosphate ABC transporter substrate-binding protein [Hyphomicrobium sp.]
MIREAALGLSFATLTLLAVTAFAAEEPSTAAPLSGQLTITGASTIAPLASEIGKRLEETNPDLRIDVQTGGSARGVADVRAGLAAIGLVSRNLKDDETDLTAFTIARDGVGIILNTDNPVSVLTDEQIVDIYLGKIANWKDVGGKDAPITVVNKAEGRSTLDLFTNYFKLKNSDIKASVVIGDNQQGIKTVAGNHNAIGYVSIGTAEFESEQGTPIKLLPLKGVAASVENVRNGTFSLARPLNLVVKAAPEGTVKSFIDFAQSKDVRDLVKEQFFVPLQ